MTTEMVTLTWLTSETINITMEHGKANLQGLW